MASQPVRFESNWGCGSGRPEPAEAIRDSDCGALEHDGSRSDPSKVPKCGVSRPFIFAILDSPEHLFGHVNHPQKEQLKWQKANQVEPAL